MSIEIQLGGLYTFGLFLTFLVLKLCGVIGWSWWWVSCPLWIAPAVLAVGGLVVLIIYIMAKWK